MHTPSHSITQPNPVRTSLGGRSGPPLQFCREKSGLVVCPGDEFTIDSEMSGSKARHSTVKARATSPGDQEILSGDSLLGLIDCDADPILLQDRNR